MEKTALGTYLLDRLHFHGVEHIFGIPGDYVLRFNKMIEEHQIKFTNTTRENTAGYMADAYARLKGLGAVCVTYGVGINVVNAVANAYVESSPLVVISGAPSDAEFHKSHHLHHLFEPNGASKRDNTQMEIFKKITTAQTVLDNPSAASWEIDRVLDLCLARKKPVYIELPRDLVGTEIPVHPYVSESVTLSDPEALEEAFQEIESLLSRAKQPVIWVGHEVHRHGLSGLLLKFAEKHRIPIVTTLLGKSTISEYHPLFLGLYQGKLSSPEVEAYVQECDCIILCGVILTDVNTGMFTAKLDKPLKIIASTECITINHHRYPDIDFVDFFAKLSHIESRTSFAEPPRKDANVKPFQASGKEITTVRLFECLQSHLSPDTIIVSDFGDCLFGSSELVVGENAFISSSYFSTLGFGVPAALGAQFARPDKRVICVVGDGAFQISGMELSTAVRYGIAPIVILLNNHGYATERPLLEGEFNDITDWNYFELPRLFNKGQGVRVTTEEQFEKALKTAFETVDEFSLIEVELDKDNFSTSLQRFCQLVTQKKM